MAASTEELLTLIAVMDRSSLLGLLGNLRPTFPLDFTPEFLDSVTVDRLRHIIAAVALHCPDLPGQPMALAA